MVQGLQSEDPTEQLASLTSLNDLLTYSTDEGLLMGGFSGTQSIPLLVSRIMESSDPTILLLATKTLTQMFDLVPPTIITAAQAGAPQVRPFGAWMTTDRKDPSLAHAPLYQLPPLT